jgi:hypothetical protein
MTTRNWDTLTAKPLIEVGRHHGLSDCEAPERIARRCDDEECYR